LLRVFSMFPDGLPGVGLFLLRAAAGAALLVQGAAYFVDWHDLPLLTVAIALLTIASGAALLIGYLTPFAGIVAGLISTGGAFSWLPVPNLYLFEARLTAILATVIVAALVCLGPGAFSLDARLFGRREIIIPSSPSQKP
jgi:uncharacterized membrane protein YphA (DoxX/SURF4 family)